MFVLSPFLPKPPNGENQRTILIAGNSEPVEEDYPENLDTEYDPAGGGLCFVSTAGFGTIDCLEWGSGAAGLNAGSPAAPGGIPAGQSLNRSIASGCPTLLEPADDTDDSASDFALAAPTPRPNATAPTEQACEPPQTVLDKTPKERTRKRKAKFRFSADEAGATFECKLDGKPYKPCTSPQRYGGLERGRHRFRVRATGADGLTDPTPAEFAWKIRRP